MFAIYKHSAFTIESPHAEHAKLELHVHAAINLDNLTSNIA